MWSISFCVKPSLETMENRQMSFLCYQEPAMSRWCPLQNDNSRSVFSFGKPPPQGPNIVYLVPNNLFAPVTALKSPRTASRSFFLHSWMAPSKSRQWLVLFVIFVDPEFLMVPRFPVSHFQSPPILLRNTRPRLGHVYNER